MKLYYYPEACSLSPHITLREAGLPFDLVYVDLLGGKKTSEGEDYLAINPKGYVAALRLDDGQILTEVAVIVQYIADLRPESGLAPRPGTFERVRLQEWLVFISTELHRGLAPYFSPKAPDELREQGRQKLKPRLDVLASGVEGRPYLLGDTFTVADAHAYFALRAWRAWDVIPLPPRLRDYYARLGERPAVRAALSAEGLSP